MQFIVQGNAIPNEAQVKLLREIERMSSICKDLLGFARPGEEGIVDLNEVVRTTRRYLSTRDAIQIDFHLSSEALPVRAAANEIQQVVLNLFQNAQDALDGVSKPRISIRTVQSEDAILLELE